MGGGGKGGSQTTTVQIPAWLQEAAQRNLARADQTSTIGYTPYYGPDVAALTPMQQAAMANTNQAALSFGLAAPSDPMAGVPLPQTFSGGVQGYGSGGLYDQALGELKLRMPGQFAALQAPFINPITGAMPTGVYGTPDAPAPAAAATKPSGSQDTYRDRQETRALIDAMGRGSGSSGSFASSALAARLPGGINTKNPNSVVNRTAAALTSKPQKAPTASNRPQANPKRK